MENPPPFPPDSPPQEAENSPPHRSAWDDTDFIPPPRSPVGVLHPTRKSEERRELVRAALQNSPEILCTIRLLAKILLKNKASPTYAMTADDIESSLLDNGYRTEEDYDLRISILEDEKKEKEKQQQEELLVFSSEESEEEKRRKRRKRRKRSPSPDPMEELLKEFEEKQKLGLIHTGLIDCFPLFGNIPPDLIEGNLLLDRAEDENKGIVYFLR